MGEFIALKEAGEEQQKQDAEDDDAILQDALFVGSLHLGPLQILLLQETFTRRQHPFTPIHVYSVLLG